MFKRVISCWSILRWYMLRRLHSKRWLKLIIITICAWPKYKKSMVIAHYWGYLSALPIVNNWSHRGAVTDWDTDLPVFNVRMNRFLKTSHSVLCSLVLLCNNSKYSKNCKRKCFVELSSPKKFIIHKLGSLDILAETLTTKIYLAVRAHT